MTFERQDAILRRFFDAIGTGHISIVEAIYHPDAVIWHSNDNATQSVSENLPVLRWVARSISGLSYDEIRRVPMDSGQVLQTHVLRGRGPNGKDLAFYAAIVFTFDEAGRITRLEEYLDSGQVAVLNA